MKEQIMSLGEKKDERLLSLCKTVAGDAEVAAVCLCSDYALGLSVGRNIVEILLVIRGFQPRMRYYLRSLDARTVAVLAVDQWVFERDVDRGFLGEAFAGGLMFPYKALENAGYLHDQEVRLKERIVLELLENIVFSFPELSYELRIKPEYFMYEAMLMRARIFPPTMYGSLDFLQHGDRKAKTKAVLDGYMEAISKLEGKGLIFRSEGYVRLPQSFVNGFKEKRVKFANLLKPAQRALFASLAGAFPRVMTLFSQNREILLGLQRFTHGNSRIVPKLELPERYLFIPTSSGLVPLANRVDMESFAREVLSLGRDEKVDIEEIGGALNDVFLITTWHEGNEEKIAVKRFKDWSSIKWFPLTLWTIGTRTFAVLGRSRLEREVAINDLLASRGFRVPKVLYVNADERLVFMEFLEGENVGAVIKRLALPPSAKKEKKDFLVIERVGKKIAKIHALNIALGDAKPENVLINRHGEICLMDFEQAARGGDIVWDIAEFLYYAGHLLPPLADVQVAESIAEAFIRGYLKAGGRAETIRKAGTPKYTKVFSVFTLPHVMLAISSVCRRAKKLEDGG